MTSENAPNKSQCAAPESDDYHIIVKKNRDGNVVSVVWVCNHRHDSCHPQGCGEAKALPPHSLADDMDHVRAGIHIVIFVKHSGFALALRGLLGGYWEPGFCLNI